MNVSIFTSLSLSLLFPKSQECTHVSRLGSRHLCPHLSFSLLPNPHSSIFYPSRAVVFQSLQDVLTAQRAEGQPRLDPHTAATLSAQHRAVLRACVTQLGRDVSQAETDHARDLLQREVRARQ